MLGDKGRQRGTLLKCVIFILRIFCRCRFLSTKTVTCSTTVTRACEAMETRNNNRAKAYVYLVGHGLLILGFTFFTVGFATDHWLSSGSELYGLWVRCLGQVCVATSSGFAGESTGLIDLLINTLIVFMIDRLID